MNENAPNNNQEEGVDMSYVEMAQGAPSVMDNLRAAQESGNPAEVEAAQAAADEKYLNATETPEQKREMMEAQTEKAIAALISALNNINNASVDVIEGLVADVANDLASLRTLRQKSGVENATVADELGNFPALNNPMLQPLKDALMSYGPNDYGAPKGVANMLFRRKQAESMNI